MANKNNLREIGACMKKEVAVLPPDAKLINAVKLMAKKSISCVIIIKDKKPVGILTERDMIKRVLMKKLDPKKEIIEKVMSSPVFSVQPEAILVPTGELMKKKKIRRFAVTDKNGNLVGLVTQTDIIEGILKLVKHLDWKLVTMKISVAEYIKKLKELRIL